MSPVLCLDVGSTWTKGALVAGDGSLLGTAQHPSTPPEVRDGIDAVRAAVGAGDAEALACSSAGGGLRLAVVGQERLVSAEAGYRAALSAGAKVCHVTAGMLDDAAIGGLVAAAPDLVLLTGGTDGGDTRVLRHNALMLAAQRPPCPVVLAGNAAVREETLEVLVSAGVVAIPAANVLPDIGELDVEGARSVIRDLFLSHVIGGKGLSSWDGFPGLVRTVTPDAVRTGVARLAGVLAAEQAGSVLVVDVGGATTDVYSAVPDAASGDDPTGHAVGLDADRRSVEGDLGMRFSAPDVLTEAVAERLLDAGACDELCPAARRRSDHVHEVPTAPAEQAVDATLARLASVLAVRRHLRMVDGNLGPRGVGLVVLSGGALRHARGERLAEVVEGIATDPVLRPVIRRAPIVLDADYVLAPAGLLAAEGRHRAAGALLDRHLVVRPSVAR